MDCSTSGSSVRGILQARILELLAILFSRMSSQPRDQTQASPLQADPWLSEPPPGSPSTHLLSTICQWKFRCSYLSTDSCDCFYMSFCFVLWLPVFPVCLSNIGAAVCFLLMGVRRLADFSICFTCCEEGMVTSKLLICRTGNWRSYGFLCIFCILSHFLEYNYVNWYFW